MKEVKLNPINEDELEDKRNVISENCFTELDIAAKAWLMCFGEDVVYEEISLLRSTFAYMLGNHKNEHGLSNVDIIILVFQNLRLKMKTMFGLTNFMI